MPEFWRVEFHCHTHRSPDCLTTPARLLAACRRRGIDRVVVTDHNEIRGALEARSLDPQRVIVGEEIETRRGELLAVFVQERVPPGLEPEEAIRRLRAQGAFIAVSHPLDRQRGWALPDLLEILPLVDALEVFNARCLLPAYDRAAAALAREHGLPGIVGSDAHSAMEIGRATLLLPPFEDADGLRAALREACPRVRRSSPLVHLVSSGARLIKTVLDMSD